ncbi:hypothetical protein WAI453_010151 [Rhynchosporium graminicola]
MANHQSQCNFKAIIIGGSVAGLTFAHMFERANINCILLESRYRISPSEAASIVIMPKGARILDQLGYINGICERRIFLRSIFDQLKDKSRVKTDLSTELFIVTKFKRPTTAVADCWQQVLGGG